MVEVCCFCDHVEVMAEEAERVGCEVGGSELAPSVVIASCFAARPVVRLALRLLLWFWFCVAGRSRHLGCRNGPP